MRKDKRGHIPDRLPNMLQRLDMDARRLSDLGDRSEGKAF